MKKVTRLKTETQFINRANNERAYTQALHSILFLSRVLNKGNQSYDIGTFRLSEGESAPFQYTDTIVLIDGSTRQEFYTALVQQDCIHIKISFIQEWNEKPDEDFAESSFHEPIKVLGQIDLDKCS